MNKLILFSGSQNNLNAFVSKSHLIKFLFIFILRIYYIFDTPSHIKPDLVANNLE